MTDTATSVASGSDRPVSRPLRLFMVAGEHSGDSLGGGLMAALKRQGGADIVFAGVGGEHMQAEGLTSLFALSDIAVMGPIAILKRLAPIVRRVYQSVDAAVAFAPDAVVIIDAPEFTHAVAKRIRRRRPDIPIINYVSPTVWAWRPGRARAMRPYVDHLLALLPFEPDAHLQLGGPRCSYVGHPLVERLDWLASLDPTPLRDRLGLDPARRVLVVLPGSRRSEVGRLLDVFGAAVRVLADRGWQPEVLVPAVSSLQEMIEQQTATWPRPPHVLTGEDDKWQAFKLADAALAKSGTVTLELAAAGTPMVIAYKVEPLIAPVLRRLIRIDTAGLANLVLGEKAFPEFMQEDCTADRLADALADLLAGGAALQAQRAALTKIPGLLAVAGDNPSATAAAIVLAHAVV